MTEYRHTPDMGEISGFAAMGGQGVGYEQCCQDMLNAGVNWVLAHPGADLRFFGSDQVTGLFIPAQDCPEAIELEQVVADASFDPKTGHREATGAQVHVVLMRCLYIAKEGWESYCEELRKQQRLENGDDKTGSDGMAHGDAQPAGQQGH